MLRASLERQQTTERAAKLTAESWLPERAADRGAEDVAELTANSCLRKELLSIHRGLP